MLIAKSCQDQTKITYAAIPRLISKATSVDLSPRSAVDADSAEKGN